MKSIYKGKKVILGVDRLDYIKGLCQKLEGFRRFLEKYNEHRDDTVLIQVAVPSREEVQEYVDLRSLVFETVGAINGKYGSSDHTPISLINQSVNMTELCALYKIADACVVSSTRDGMNLVSYEYVACQQESHGVLILSEFAGAAQSLNGALIVNPWNLEELADSFQEALLMDPEFKKESHSRLIKYVKKHTASFWGCNFIAELEVKIWSSS